MASPNLTAGVAVLANVSSLGASATTSAGTTTFAAGDLEYRMQLVATFGTVAATAGAQLNVYQVINAVADTVALLQQVLTASGSSTQKMSLDLPAGNYSVTVTNLDASNAITNVSVTMDKIIQ